MLSNLKFLLFLIIGLVIAGAMYMAMTIIAVALIGVAAFKINKEYKRMKDS